MADALFALIDDAGGVSETRRVDPADVATHKLAPDGGPRLRPLVQTPAPAYAPALEARRLTYTVAQHQVEEAWIVERLPIGAQLAAVKTECGRRIFATLPAWKQTNFLARATELTDKRAGGASLDAGEQAEWDAMQALWNWVKATRAASNAIEAADPSPLDFTKDELWPTPPGA